MIPTQNPADYEWALKRIKQLWNEGTVVILAHAQEHMALRQLDISAIQHIIKYGKIIEHTLSSHQVWRYKITGTAVDGQKAVCVLEVTRGLIIVTVITDAPRRKSRSK